MKNPGIIIPGFFIINFSSCPKRSEPGTDIKLIKRMH